MTDTPETHSATRARLHELLEGTTPGEWYRGCMNHVCVAVPDSEDDGRTLSGRFGVTADAEIAAAAPDIAHLALDLLDEVARLRAALAEAYLWRTGKLMFGWEDPEGEPHSAGVSAPGS